MAKRQSIEIPGFSHANPIPGASRIGNIVMNAKTTRQAGAKGENHGS